MKKIIIIIIVVVTLFIAALAAVPIIFKQPLLEKIKIVLNKNVNAEVEFSDLKLSLFRSFPMLSLELTDVMIRGKDDFQNDTLLSVNSMRAKTPLSQLFNKENMSIEEIILNQPLLNLVVSDSGNVNWDLAVEAEPVKEDLPSDDGLELKLDRINISDAGFIYNDREAGMLVLIDDIDIDISGKMYGTSAQLLADGKAKQFSLLYGDVKYISGVALETRSVLNVDYEKMDIKIEENELFVNRLPMEVKGMIRVPDDTMSFDLQLKTKESGFDNFLALVPPDYEEYLKDIETSGNAVIEGTVNGYYYEDDYPAFNLNIEVVNGNFHYQDLPEQVKNISADIAVMKPQGILDLTEVKISRAHAEVKNSPVDLALNLKNLVSDLHFDGSFTGNVKFDEWKDALPLDSIDISGVIDANLVVNGNYSSIEKEEYDKIRSDGSVRLTNFIYQSPSLTQKILVPEGNLEFTPRAVNLSGLNVNIGQSDLNLTGNVTNYLDYIFNGETLSANMRLTSSLLNLNEILRLQIVNDSVSAQSVADSTSAGDNLAFDIPENINFSFQSDIQRVIFEKLPITDVNGSITAQDGKLVLDGLNMSMLGGELNLTGSYENTPEDKPLFDFGFDILKADIPMAFQTLTSIQKMIPIARNSVGKFSTGLKVKGQLSPDFNLIASTVDGLGSINTENLSINESPLFNQLKGLLKSELLKNVKVNDFSANVEITRGGILLKPFTTKISNQEVTISGILNTSNLLDMKLDFMVEREAFGPDIENILKMLPGEERINILPAAVLLKGPVGDPEVSINLEEARKQITEEVKKSAKEDIQKSLNKIGEGLKNILK
jgi:uncharacterized protein involved in outer membrane biogenesis